MTRNISNYPLPGTICTVNTRGDIYMSAEARPFIGARCIVIKITKSGLVQIALESNVNLKYSVPLSNIEFRTNPIHRI
jgi:hypothetical protein